MDFKIGDAVKKAGEVGSVCRQADTMPKIRLPKRDRDCNCAPVCEAIGNIGKVCLAGNELPVEPGPNLCMKSVILLISRALGMWPQEMIDETERSRIGFVGDENSR